MYEYSATLVRAIDGDTVDLDIDLGFHVTVRERFRLLGIDTPELHASDPAIRAAATAARDALSAQLTGQPLTVRTAKEAGDKYGRWLATIFLPGSTTSVNDWMIAQGFARPYDGGAK